jgi:hypothetical protein
MKKFTSSFQIEVSTNQVAEKLLSSMDPKIHSTTREAIVESIITPMETNKEMNTLKHMYFALFGIDVESPIFKESDYLLCTKKRYGYFKAITTDGEKGNSAGMIEKREPIGQCRLIGFDTYKVDNKYQVEFETTNREGEKGVDSVWCDPTDLKLSDVKGNKKVKVNV